MSKIHRILQNSLPGSGTPGDIYLTDEGKLYMIGGDNRPKLMYSNGVSNIESQGDTIKISKFDGSSSSINIPKGEKGDQGPVGPKGTDGLTTSVTVNGQKYTHSNGNITLPNFLKEEGGKLTGPINNNMDTGTYLDGNKGKALINSTNRPGGYTTLIKGNSTNGVFTLSSYLETLILCYTSNESISSGVNKIDSRLTLLDEYGNTTFPNSIKAEKILGPNTIKLSRDSIFLGYLGSSQTCDNLRLGDAFIASDSNRNIHFIDMNGQPTSLYLNTVYTKSRWIKIGERWLTIDTSAPSGVKGDIWIQCF